MIDGRFKSRLDSAWNALAPALVRMGFTANGVTWTGLALAAAAAVTYPLYAQPWIFALLVAAISAFDSLDGAVARTRGTESRYGGYLDAIADRYQETMAIAALAWAHECWPAAFLAITGALHVSYAKARCAIEQPIDNVAWPDLMERLERIVVLCVGLVAASFMQWPADFPIYPVGALLLALGLLNHATAVQRFLRARRLLRAAYPAAPVAASKDRP